MEDFYEINVALNGRHFFATAPRSIHTEKELKSVYATLREKFPKEEGYTLHVEKWESRGQQIDMMKL